MELGLPMAYEFGWLGMRVTPMPIPGKGTPDRCSTQAMGNDKGGGGDSQGSRKLKERRQTPSIKFVFRQMKRKDWKKKSSEKAVKRRGEGKEEMGWICESTTLLLV